VTIQNVIAVVTMLKLAAPIYGVNVVPTRVKPLATLSKKELASFDKLDTFKQHRQIERLLNKKKREQRKLDSPGKLRQDT
jgi:hypothetical protein